jgi:hypothetical protein
MRKLLVLAGVGLLAYHYKDKLFASVKTVINQTPETAPGTPIIQQTPVITTLPNGQTVITIPQNYEPTSQNYYQATSSNYGEPIGNYEGETFVVNNPDQFYLDFVKSNNNVIFSDNQGFSVLVKNQKVKIASGKEINTYPAEAVEFSIWNYFINNLPQYVTT